jgi:phage terminase small subunit
MAKQKLSERRRRFVAAYIETLNQSEAARRAGYKQRADVAGARLVVNGSVKAEISRLLQNRRDAAKDTDAENVLNLWRSVQTDENLPMSYRIKASELLAKFSGILTDKLEITGKDGQPLKVEYEQLPITAKE